MSDDIFFFLKTKEMRVSGKTIEHSKIYMVESQFGNFMKSEVYEDKCMKAEILNFGVDNTRKRLIILTGIKNSKNRSIMN